jgi:antirestriction protein ArdC
MSKQQRVNRVDVYESVTNKVIEALEAGVDGTSWKAPWHSDNTFGIPENIKSRKPYRGVNTWVLVAEQFLKGYRHPLWGTFKQWKDKGAFVRKGEHGTTVILWKPTDRKVKDDNGEDGTTKSLLARAFTVFNVDQVEGYEVETVEPAATFDPIAHAEQFFGEIGADVSHGGGRAYYSPGADRIQLPFPEDFVDNVAYYAVSAHEHVHWTGHEKRCNREFGGRFGNDAYAVEELVAELGAAYVCGILGLANEPRSDHTQYLAHWLKVLKADPKAIVTAASNAQRAVDFLVDHAGESTVDEKPEVVADDVELERAVA